MQRRLLNSVDDKEGDVHLEESSLIFLAGLRLDLLSEFDYWLKLRIVLLVL